MIMKKYVLAFSTLFSAVIILVMALTALAETADPRQPPIEVPQTDVEREEPAQEPSHEAAEGESVRPEPFHSESDSGKGGAGERNETIPPGETENDLQERSLDETRPPDLLM